MARKARERAQSGLYFVEVVSNDRLVFIEEDDYRYFLTLLRKAAEEDFAELCAYCLFEEQLFFVIKEGLSGISEFMRRVLPKYTTRYNVKYSREGKLFGGRFKSRPLETQDEFLDAVRYVHRLPLQRRRPDGLKYIWSSYNGYVKGESEYRGGALMLLLGESNLQFRLEMDKESDFLRDEKKLTDAEVAALLKEKLSGMTSEEVENMSREQHAELVRFLHASGVSIRRLAKLLHVSKSAVERCLK